MEATDSPITDGGHQGTPGGDPQNHGGGRFESRHRQCDRAHEATEGQAADDGPDDKPNRGRPELVPAPGLCHRSDRREHR